ncbi:MAG: serine/threonine-protein kinase [Chthoniobacteraceae bacterium]
MNTPSPTSDSPKTCQKCGGPMAGNSPEGLCARCLLSAALKEPTGTGAAIPNAPAPEEIAPLFPQFDIIALLGRGGMGVVYQARQPQLDRLVALKILPPETAGDPAFAARFSQEARALARLSHPNIVAVHDFGQAGDLYYLIMEYVDGTNLRELIRGRNLTPKEALAIVPKICSALQFAHDEGIMHRDIKPENILIDKKGRVKIADFGLAKLLGHEPLDAHLTAAGTSVGTPTYMAPEQLEHPDEVDHRADIYSLGVVIYEMLTGELPLGRFALPSAKAQVDVRLDEVVLRSLEKDVTRRYQHVSDVQNDVENISGLLDRLPARVRNLMGFDYKSKQTLFGLPLLHITSGRDPVTGKRRIARGIVAAGDIAQGLIAFGGVAMGGFAFGGLCVGIVTFGGVGFALLAIGGVAISLLGAYGGVAIGTFAFGGVALGWWVAGGVTGGIHVLDGATNDPVGRAMIAAWAKGGMALFWALFIPGMIGNLALQWWGRRQSQSLASSS